MENTKQPKKVLIIEDEGDMCLLLNIMLNGQEMELDHVKDLKAAEEYLQNEQPSVLILDNKLPDGFGMDFIPFLKKNHPAVKIIMISGYDASAEDAALAAAGGDHAVRRALLDAVDAVARVHRGRAHFPVDRHRLHRFERAHQAQRQPGGAGDW